jgi:hypothetical protein
MCYRCNPPYRRISSRKYWFEFSTTRGKIRPIQPFQPARMNEELRTASDLARDPASVSWATYTWVVFVAILGGVVRLIREVNLSDKTWRQIMLAAFVELATSLFVGMTKFFICRSAEFNDWKTATMVSIASFLGGKAIVVLKVIYRAGMTKGE